MKANSSRTKGEEIQFLKPCQTTAGFGITCTNDGLQMENEIKTLAVTKTSDEEDVEVELDVGSNDCMYDQVSGLPSSNAENSNQSSIVKTVTNTGDEGDKVDVDVGSSKCMYDQASGLHCQGENVEKLCVKTPSAVIPPTVTFDEREEMETTGLEKESPAKNGNTWHDQLLEDDEDEDDPYNRFYFESDHLALKENKQ